MRKSSEKLIITEKNGTTLVEVVVSMALVAMTLFSLWEGFNLAFLTNQRGGENQRVALQATTILEGLSDEQLQTLSGAGTWQVAAKGGVYGYSLRVRVLDQQVFETQKWGLYETVLVISAQQEWPFYQIKQVRIQ